MIWISDRSAANAHVAIACSEADVATVAAVAVAAVTVAVMAAIVAFMAIIAVARAVVVAVAVVAAALVHNRDTVVAVDGTVVAIVTADHALGINSAAAG